MFENIFKLDLNSLKKEPLVIEPAVVDHCNLNCAYCDHLTPLADKGFYDVKQFEKDFKALGKVLSSREILDKYDIYLGLVGGEPFLHPQLFDFIDIILDNFDVNNIKQLSIMTNCTMFKYRKDLSDKYKSNRDRYERLGFILSHYNPINVEDIRRDYEEFLGHEAENFTVEDHLTFDKVNLDFNHKEMPNECYCGSMYMRDGFLCHCPIIGNSKFLLQKAGLPESLLSEDNFISLDNTLTPDKIIWLHDNLTSFCRYCRPRNKRLNWRYSDFDVREWLDKDFIIK